MRNISTLLSATVLMLLSTNAFAQFDITKLDSYKMLDLTQPLNPTSFEFDADTKTWNETYNEADYTFWESQVFMFSHLIDGEGASYGGLAWNGFTVSKNASTADMSSAAGGWVKNQWGCMAGGGISSFDIMSMQPIVSADAPYIIAYCADWTMDQSNQIMFNDGNTYNAVGTYVCMHPWAYYNCLSGGGVARALNQEGDYFSVIAHASLNGGDEKTVELKLAEYKDGVLNMSADWQWMDLSSLGEFDLLYFTIDGSDKGDWGLNTASYFCMDRFIVESVETSAQDENAEDSSNVQKVRINDRIYIINGDKKYTLLGAEVK